MPRLRPSQRSALIASGLLLVLLATPVVFTWRAWRQEKLNQALIAAVKQNNSSQVSSLLIQGADANACDHTATPSSPLKMLALWMQRQSQPLFPTALLIAAKNTPHNKVSGYDDVEERKRSHAIVDQLLHAGAVANVRDAQGTTPLMYAAWNRKATVVRLLLQHGANMNMRNNAGDTALSRMLIVGWEWPAMDADGNYVVRTSIRRLLIRAGATK